MFSSRWLLGLMLQLLYCRWGLFLALVQTLCEICPDNLNGKFSCSLYALFGNFFTLDLSQEHPNQNPTCKLFGWGFLAIIVFVVVPWVRWELLGNSVEVNKQWSELTSMIWINIAVVNLRVLVHEDVFQQVVYEIKNVTHCDCICSALVIAI